MLQTSTSNGELKVAFYTLGCKLNFAESSIIGSNLESKGFKRVNFDQFADVYNINTCSVTESADRKCRRAIRSALLQTGTSIIDIATGGKLSRINRSTGMNTIGLLSQIGIMNPFNRKQESEAD